MKTDADDAAARGPMVTAVVVCYRSRDAVARALKSLQPAHESGLLRCIAVDNHSGDGTAEMVRATFPWATSIDSDENVGFARGCNLALARATTPYVLLLNPDAELSLPDLHRLLEFVEARPLVGMAAPAIRMADGRLQHAGGAPTPRHLLAQACRPRWLPPGRRTIQPGGPAFRTDWLCGAVLLVRTAMLRDIGSFDPRFFLYFEETDLCRRAVAAGWQLWAVGGAQAQHLGGASARATGSPLVHGCIAEHYFRSRFRFFRKHHGLAVACLTEVAELAVLAAVALVRSLAGRDIEDFRIRVRAPILGRPARSPALGRSS
jgi:GT2 family glycosyltransferase